MEKIKIVFFEITPNEKKYIKKQFDKSYELEFHKEALTETNSDLIKDADVISIFIYSKINEAVIAEAGRLKLVTTRSTGYNHIDLGVCQSKGINVCNVPYYGENTVAEHTFALILALSRNLHKAYVRTTQGNYSLDGLRGFDLKGKTLGVIGAGNIGVHVMKIANGFGMHVKAFDVKANHILEDILDCEFVSMDDLLSSSDIITLHCPYNEHTHHLLNMENIKLIKKGTLFINTARSAIIEPAALYYAIDSGIFGGAGLDVFEGEELALEENQMLTKNVSVEHVEAIMRRNILLRRENVIITPHMAFDSEEAVQRILDTTAKNIKSFYAKKRFYKVI